MSATMWPADSTDIPRLSSERLTYENLAPLCLTARFVPMIEIAEPPLDTGLPLVQLSMPGTRAATALVAFDAGARTERPEENGMAHFLEHLVFKGGEKYATYRDVNNTAERLGAQLNAYTSHDIVAFHITCRAEALMPAVDLLTD